uniref:Reticulocyte-binding protein 2 homolog a-like n=1 Tax=Diabrotica virgifera virgifera TaxID=50390 RepID=A0A6P7FZY6_DIAVI
MSVTRKQSKKQERKEDNNEEEINSEVESDKEQNDTVTEEKQETGMLEKLMMMMKTQQAQQETMMNTQESMMKKQQEETRTMMKVQQENKKMTSQIEKKLDKYEHEVKGYLQQIQKEVDRIAEETQIKLENQRKTIENLQEQIEHVEEKTYKKLEAWMEKMEKKLDRTLQKDKFETKKEIKEIQKIVEEMGKRNAVRENREGIIQTSSDIKIKFGGDVRKQHPVTFIRIIKNQFQHISNFEDCKEAIRSYLTDGASLWFEIKENTLVSWMDFEKKFLKYFWEKKQMEINNELQNGKFDERKGISEERHALQIYNNAQHLEYNYSQEQLVELIARHFDETMEDYVTLQNYRDIDSL